MSADLLQWGKPGDGQGERLLGVILLALFVLTVAFVWATDQGEPARGEHPACAAEDMIMVEVRDEAYPAEHPLHLDAGQLVCVHIDAVEEP